MNRRSIDQEILNAAHYWQHYSSGPYTYDELVELAASRGEVLDEWRGRAMIAREHFIWNWADAGFTTFRCAPSYAAALMVTDPSKGDDLIIPWRAVRIEVPPGLLETEACHVRWIYVDSGSEGNKATLAYSDRPIMAEHHHDDLAADGAIYRVRAADTLADVLCDRSAREMQWLDGEPYLNDEKERVMLLCCNYVSGLLYTLQHTRDWHEREHKNRWGLSLSNGPRPPPNHRNVICGRPINVNLTPMVQAQARGESRRSMPAMFQSCVRGHYKRQVIGVGRTGRKVIWIEPYWRGPEGAPLLVRPYQFTG